MLIILYATLFGLVLIAQELYVYKTGDLRWFILRPWTRSRPRTPPKLRIRMVSGSVYIVGGIALLTQLARIGARHLPALIDRVHPRSPDAGFLAISVALLAVGAWCLANPIGMVRWVRTANADVAETSSIALRVTRLVGTGLLLVASYGIFLSFFYLS
jgi:hypothetical protein